MWVWLTAVFLLVTNSDKGIQSYPMNKTSLRYGWMPFGSRMEEIDHSDEIMPHCPKSGLNLY